MNWSATNLGLWLITPEHLTRALFSRIYTAVNTSPDPALEEEKAKLSRVTSLRAREIFKYVHKCLNESMHLYLFSQNWSAAMSIQV